MNILFATGIFPPEGGGPATYTETMARALSRRGHRVRVITYSDEERGRGYFFPVHRIVRGNKLWNYLRYFALVLWFGRGADVLYLQDTVSAGLPTYLANKFLRKKLAARVVGDYSWEQAQNRGLTTALLDDFQGERSYPGIIGKMRAVQSRVVRACDLIIVPSNYLKNVVTGWGVSPHKIQVIYNAIDIPEGVADEKEARKRLGLSPSDFLVVSAGRDVPWKGFSTLREAVAEMNKDVEKVRLQVLSGVPRNDLLTAISAADVFALNTGYEGFPFLVLEAMSLGTPVITTNVGGNPELVTDPSEDSGQANGLLVSYNDKKALKEAIGRLLNDARLRKQLAEAGPKTVGEQFTVRRMVEETERAILKI